MWLGLTVSIGDQRRLAENQTPQLTRPLRLALYGDSFGQRSQDILGSPNSLDAGVIDPQLLKWATDLTFRVGGVQWGFANWLDMLSGGKFIAPYHLNRAIGGFNTGQLARYDVNPPFYLKIFEDFLIAQLAGPLAPDAVLFQAGTNDTVTGSTPGSRYNNVLAICDKITALGLPVMLSTVLPRGNAANPGYRVGADLSNVLDYNDRLMGRNGYPGIESETLARGKVRVFDPRSQFEDPGGQPFDIQPALEYDGLHLSAEGCRRLGTAYLAALNTWFTTPISGHLPTGATYIANGLMTGTAGTVTRTGNTTTNNGFTISGTAPDNWTVTTTLNSAATAWNGTNPTNIKGTVAVSKAAADTGEAIVISLDCDASGNTTANTRAIEAWCSVTLPDTATLPVGAYYRGLAVVELTRRNAMPIAGIRGVSAELRLTEPDAIARVTRSAGPAPNGTARMELADIEQTGSTRLVVQTPPRIRKAGTYGAIDFAVVILVQGQAPNVSAVVKISQAGVRAII